MCPPTSSTKHLIINPYTFLRSKVPRYKPDKTTRSLTLSPFEANMEIKVEMFAEGGGNWMVSFAIDTRPSFLPVATGHVGPLLCFHERGKKKDSIKSIKK